MNFIDLNGEMVTPKTESMAYTQTNNRIGVLEEKHERDIENTRQNIRETASEIGSQISNEINAVNSRFSSEISAVGNRIDNIIAHNNDTEGNSELLDIREGTDGTIYTTAGSAVRSQLRNIHTIIDAGCQHEVVNRSLNLFNQDAVSENSIISSDNPGTIAENSNYFTTDFIPVDLVNHPNIISTYAFTPSGSDHPTERRARTWKRIAGYNAQRQYVANTIATDTSSYTVTDSNVKYVRISYNNTYLDISALLYQIMVEYGTEVNTSLSHYDVYYEGDIQIKLKYSSLPSELTSRLREDIYIYANDGIESFYTKMQTAYNTGNCDVHIGKGDYIYTNALVESIRNSGKRGVPIGNGCRYYFDTGAYLYCEYTGSQNGVTGMFSPLDSMEIGSDYEIYNLNLTAKNVLYAVHDEANASDTPCRHYYENCHIELDNTALASDSDPISKALGGGLGKYEEVIIRNCIFKATNPSNSGSAQDDASYHGANRSSFTDAKIIIDGCYFENRFRTSDMAAQEPDEKHPQIIYTNNCSGVAVSIPNRWTSYVWNNVVR